MLKAALNLYAVTHRHYILKERENVEQGDE